MVKYLCSENRKTQETLDLSNSFIVSFEECPDMTPIYRKLLSLYKGKEDSCPTLIMVEDLPDGLIYLKTSDLFLLKRGYSLDDEMILSNNYYNDGNLVFFTFKDSAFDFYMLALAACHRMNIKCPQIMYANVSEKARGEVYQNNSNLTKYVLLRPGMGFVETAEVLFHELRHAWQHEKHHSKYYSDYHSYDTDLVSYLMQPAETDAEAFSVRMMVDLDMERYPVNRYESHDLNSKIEARAKRMAFPNPLD